jgi:hypothetical protein
MLLAKLPVAAAVAATSADLSVSIAIPATVPKRADHAASRLTAGYPRPDLGDARADDLLSGEDRIPAAVALRIAVVPAVPDRGRRSGSGRCQPNRGENDRSSREPDLAAPQRDPLRRHPGAKHRRPPRVACDAATIRFTANQRCRASGLRQTGPAELRSGSRGAWRSLVAHSAGGRKVAGSNPVAPTGRPGRQGTCNLPNPPAGCILRPAGVGKARGALAGVSARAGNPQHIATQAAGVSQHMRRGKK